MTKPEFIQGFALLTVQPWGRTYRGQSPEATIQAELYYKHFNKANPRVWIKVCESMATGEKWPNISELKTSLAQMHGWEQDGQRQITHNPVYSECPPEVREKLARLGVQL